MTHWGLAGQREDKATKETIMLLTGWEGRKRCQRKNISLKQWKKHKEKKGEQRQKKKGGTSKWNIRKKVWKKKQDTGRTHRRR